MPETLKPRSSWSKEGFKVMVYCSDDPIQAQMLEAAGCVAVMPPTRGAGVLATDAAVDLDGTMAVLASETVAKLDAVGRRLGSRANPVDIIGDASPQRYGDALGVLLAAREVRCGARLELPDRRDLKRRCRDGGDRNLASGQRTVLTNWLGAAAAENAAANSRAACPPSKHG